MVHMNLIITHLSDSLSGGVRNLERGVQPLARKAHRKFVGCHAHFRHVKVRTAYLEATVGRWRSVRTDT